MEDKTVCPILSVMKFHAINNNFFLKKKICLNKFLLKLLEKFKEFQGSISDYQLPALKVLEKSNNEEAFKKNIQELREDPLDFLKFLN